MDSRTAGLPAVFIGPKGLRAGWRLLIFLLMLVAMGAIARAIIIRFLIPAGFAHEKFTPSSVAVPDAFFVFIVAVAAWVMSKIEGRKIGQYGLPLKQGLMKHLWLGLWIGFLASSATVLIIYLLHGLQIASPTIRGTTILMSAAAWGGAFLLSAIAEEFLFRGYAQFTLTTGIGFWPAAAVLSALFGLSHLSNKGETYSVRCRSCRLDCCCVCFCGEPELYGARWAFTSAMTGARHSFMGCPTADLPHRTTSSM